MNPVAIPKVVPVGREAPFPGARSALILLILINLVNYVDRYVLAAVVGPIKQTFFGDSDFGSKHDAMSRALT